MGSPFFSNVVGETVLGRLSSCHAGTRRLHLADLGQKMAPASLAQ